MYLCELNDKVSIYCPYLIAPGQRLKSQVSQRMESRFPSVTGVRELGVSFMVTVKDQTFLFQVNLITWI